MPILRPYPARITLCAATEPFQARTTRIASAPAHGAGPARRLVSRVRPWPAMLACIAGPARSWWQPTDARGRAARKGRAGRAGTVPPQGSTARARLARQIEALNRRAAIESGGGVGGVEGPLLVPLHRRAARRAPVPAPHQLGGARRAQERVAARTQPRAARGRHAHHAFGLPRPRPAVGPGRQRAAQPLELRQHLRVPAGIVRRAHGSWRAPPRR